MCKCNYSDPLDAVTTAAKGGMSMKRIVMISEDDYKEIVCAMNHLKIAVNLLEASYITSEIDVQLERIENVINKEET